MVSVALYNVYIPTGSFLEDLINCTHIHMTVPHPNTYIRYTAVMCCTVLSPRGSGDWDYTFHTPPTCIYALHSY